MGVFVFRQYKKKDIVLVLKYLQFRGLILSGAKSPQVFLELISHKASASYTNSMGEDDDRDFLTKERRQGRRRRGVGGKGLP